MLKLAGAARWRSISRRCSFATRISPTTSSRIVEAHGLSPHQFELELTEGILVNNPTIAKRKLANLKELGFTLSLDDFGTGFSSIGYLRQFPFDMLKVDRSFVRDIGLNSTANALIQSLVSLGDAMDLSVIAEGIENEDQLKLLRLVQCEYVQGFLISRPVPAERDRRCSLAWRNGDLGGSEAGEAAAGSASEHRRRPNCLRARFDNSLTRRSEGACPAAA